MLKKLAYLLFLSISIISCDGSGNDESTLQSHLINFSAALAKADTATLRNLCSADFVLMDDGKIYDLQQLFTSIQSILDSNSMTRKPVDPKITIRKDAAWAHYKVSGDLVTKSGTIPLSLVEAVVFDRVEGVWKIAQVSTTRVRL